jgi:hypothetical protein
LNVTNDVLFFSTINNCFFCIVEKIGSEDIGGINKGDSILSNDLDWIPEEKINGSDESEKSSEESKENFILFFKVNILLKSYKKLSKKIFVFY